MRAVFIAKSMQLEPFRDEDVDEAFEAVREFFETDKRDSLEQVIVKWKAHHLSTFDGIAQAWYAAWRNKLPRRIRQQIDKADPNKRAEFEEKQAENEVSPLHQCKRRVPEQKVVFEARWEEEVRKEVDKQKPRYLQRRSLLETSDARRRSHRILPISEPAPSPEELARQESERRTQRERGVQTIAAVSVWEVVKTLLLPAQLKGVELPDAYPVLTIERTPLWWADPSFPSAVFLQQLVDSHVAARAPWSIASCRSWLLDYYGPGHLLSLFTWWFGHEFDHRGKNRFFERRLRPDQQERQDSHLGLFNLNQQAGQLRQFRSMFLPNGRQQTDRWDVATQGRPWNAPDILEQVMFHHLIGNFEAAISGALDLFEGVLWDLSVAYHNDLITKQPHGIYTAASVLTDRNVRCRELVHRNGQPMGTAWTTITSLLSATYMSGQLTPDFCRVITSDQLTPDFCRVITEETYPCERNQIVHGRARDYGHEIVSSIRLLWLDALLDAAQRSGLPYPEQLDAGDEWSGLRAGGTRAEPAELKETDDDQWPILDLTEDFRELKKRADEPARQHRRTFKGAYASFGDDPSLEIAQTDGEGQLRFLTRWLSPQLSLPTSGPLNLVEWSWELGDARVQRFYRQQFPQDVDTSVVLPPERPLGILEQALYAYRLGHYALSNRLLWQVIEGLLRDVAFAIPQSTITGDDDTDDDGTVVFDPTVASRHDEKANLPKLLQGAEMQAWLSKIGFDTASFDVLYKDDRNPLLHGNNLEAQFPDSCHLKIAILRILYQGVCHTGLIYPSRLDPGDFWDPCQPYRRVGVATEQAYLDLVVTSDVSAYRGLMP